VKKRKRNFILASIIAVSSLFIAAPFYFSKSERLRNNNNALIELTAPNPMTEQLTGNPRYLDYNSRKLVTVKPGMDSYYDYYLYFNEMKKIDNEIIAFSEMHELSEFRNEQLENKIKEAVLEQLKRSKMVENLPFNEEYIKEVLSKYKITFLKKGIGSYCNYYTKNICLLISGQDAILPRGSYAKPDNSFAQTVMEEFGHAFFGHALGSRYSDLNEGVCGLFVHNVLGIDEAGVDRVYERDEEFNYDPMCVLCDRVCYKVGQETFWRAAFSGPKGIEELVDKNLEGVSVKELSTVCKLFGIYWFQRDISSYFKTGQLQKTAEKFFWEANVLVNAIANTPEIEERLNQIAYKDIYISTEARKIEAIEFFKTLVEYDKVSIRSKIKEVLLQEQTVELDAPSEKQMIDWLEDEQTTADAFLWLATVDPFSRTDAIQETVKKQILIRKNLGKDALSYLANILPKTIPVILEHPNCSDDLRKRFGMRGKKGVSK